jgi:hypothetical protein
MQRNRQILQNRRRACFESHYQIAIADSASSGAMPVV